MPEDGGYSTFGQPASDEEQQNGHIKLPLASALQEGNLTPLLPSQSFAKKYIAPSLLLSASLLFCGMHCVVRYLTKTFHTSVLFISLFRSVVQTMLSGATVVRFHSDIAAIPMSKRSMYLLFLRASIGSIAVIMHYEALARLPVAVATCLFSTTPIFASILGWLFLHERLTTRDQAAIVITTLGTFLVAIAESQTEHLDAPLQYLNGVIYGLFAASTSASIYVFMRAMGTRVHYMLSVFSLGLFTSLVCVVADPFLGGEMGTSVALLQKNILTGKTRQLFALLAVGAFGFTGSVAQNRGSQLIAAGRGAVLRTIDIPINFLAGLLFLGEVLKSPLQISGCCLIAISAYLVASKATS